MSDDVVVLSGCSKINTVRKSVGSFCHIAFHSEIEVSLFVKKKEKNIYFRE